MVEQLDTEAFGDASLDRTLFPEVETGDEGLDTEFYMPPVRTKTWFHTGAYLEGRRISRGFEDEYFHPAPGSIGPNQPDMVLPEGRTPTEAREAVRALKGRALRVEVYADDGTELATNPYSVAETNFAVRRIQPKAGNAYASFLVSDRESLTFQYECNAEDPRVAHAMTLEVDAYGVPRKTVSIGYPRREPSEHDEQNVLSVVMAETEVHRREQRRTGTPCGHDGGAAGRLRIRLPLHVA